MPFTKSQGVRIHYQLEGDGPPVVLQHGFTDSLESWYELGYVDALSNDYKLILVDARGHGASEKPHNPEAYGTRLNAADIIAVLDELEIPNAHFLGYSMGGRIGFAIAKYAAARFFSLIIGGAHPFKETREALDPWLQLLKKGPEAMASLWDGPISPQHRARVLANDIEAIMACFVERMDSPGFDDLLPVMPCFLFVGEADRRYPALKECATRMSNSVLVSFPGLTHAECILSSSLVLPHIRKFLATVTQT